MQDAWLLVPDFVLIALGWLICRHTALNRPLWDGAERLVYYLLFPALLFNTILRNPMPVATALPLVACGWAVIGSGVALAFATRLAPGVDKHLHASGAQTAFRFNSYVALALAERLAGAPGLAWMALLVSVCVPLCNVAAVWPLARAGGHGYLRELARNPLILSTLAGLVCNLLGITLPEVVSTTLGRIGAAALPLGLMAVGAGLQIGAMALAPRLGLSFMLIRHLLLPLLGIALVLGFDLPPAQQLVVVIFAAMPTASSAYVLATRMGGHGPFVAGLVTLSTLLAMPGLPLAMGLWRWISASVGG